MKRIKKQKKMKRISSILFFKLLFILLIFNSPIYSQSVNTIYELYQNKEFKKLKEKLNSIKANLPKAEQLFFETLFINDAEQAYTIYKDLFNKYDGKVKYYAADRLKDYYYAKGYYSTASDYERYLVENRALIENSSNEIIHDAEESPVDTDKFYIQVGAFGLHENAEQMQEMLKTQKIDSKIITREVKSKTLYCVWIPGKEEFSETLNYANELKQMYHLDFNIIKE
jgi:hypothetical protein